MKKNLYILFFLTAGTLLSAGSIQIRPERGVGVIEHTSYFMIFFRDKKMRETAQSHQVFPANPAGKTDRWQGKWKLPNGSVVDYDFSEKTSPDGKSVELDYRLTSPVPVEYETLSLRFRLNGSDFAGRFLGCDNYAFPLPEKFDKNKIFLGALNDLKKLTVPLRSGMLIIEASAKTSGQILDFRKALGAFIADLYFIPVHQKTFTKAHLKVKLTIVPYDVRPLSIRNGANSTFSDQANGDHKGGWTDQGSTLDLRAIPAGKLKKGFAEFNIVRDSARECIVLGGGGRPYLPKKTTVAFPPVKMRTLLLLHASAWPASRETGRIIAEFARGGSCVLKVINNRDIGNWWNPTGFSNFKVAYQGQSSDGENVLGLGCSCFILPDQPIHKLHFESSGKSVWMIAAVSVSPQILSLQRDAPYTFKRSKEWRPLATKRDIIPGSALDFSFMQDAPAGKYGFLKTTPSGHFQFEKGKAPVRFFGVNLCATSVFLPEKQQERLADILARIGYNAVRLHHIDMILTKPKGKKSLVFDPEKLRLLDHLIALFKKRGIYVNIDLFSNRKMAPGEFKSQPDIKTQSAFKLAAMLNSEVNANLKGYARILLTHKNKYTGLSLAEDPILIGICVLNENTIYDIYEKCVLEGNSSARFCDQLFQAWCRIRKLSPSPQQRPAVMRRFLREKYQVYWKDIVKFLKNELKIQIPLTEQNHHQSPLLYSMRNEYDYVDNHYYWDHPAWIGKIMYLPPVQIRNTSSLTAEILPVRLMAPTRIFGKPFTITEFSWCYPNEYRSEGALLMGAYSSLQDWDAIYQFDFSTYYQAVFEKGYPGPFAVCNDLARLLLERVQAAFFIRRDVASSAKSVVIALKPDDFSADYVDGYPQSTQRLPFMVKIGTDGWKNGKFDNPLPEDTLGIHPILSKMDCKGKKLFTGLHPHESVAAELGIKNGKEITSSTGELTLDFQKKLFKAVTHRSEAMLLPQGSMQEGNFLSAKAIKNYATVAAVSVDGKPLKNSNRILLLHVTDARQENTVYLSHENQVVIKDPKKEDLMLGKMGKVQMTLALSPGKFELFALERDGSRIGKVPFRTSAKGICFDSDTFRFPGKVVFAYELRRIH